MAVFDTTNIVDTDVWTSKTPPNLDQNNYWLNTLQQKIDADWEYRPNRAIIESEKCFGSERYAPKDVVLQSVKNDKGQDISGDYRRVVFKNIHEACHVGQRYRFAQNLKPTKNKEKKNVWIAINQDPYTSTASQVICRCNGVLGSQYYTGDKIVNHYEPVIFPRKMNTSGLWLGDVIFDQKGSMIVIAQYNKYTTQYYINQRFIIGDSQKKFYYENGQMKSEDVVQVYKITNIQKNETSTTYNRSDVGIVYLYLEADQMSDMDNVETMIAHNGLVPEQNPKTIDVVDEDTYVVKIVEPAVLPKYLGQDDFIFKPVVYKNGSIFDDAVLDLTLSLSGNAYASLADINDFVQLSSGEDGSFVLSRQKQDPTFVIVVTCSMAIGDKTIQTSFNMIPWGE